MPLTSLSITEAAAQLAAGTLSPVALAEAHLARIATHDGALHSFITVAAELALSQAQQAEAEIRRGAWRGPLHGIPLAHKDLFDTAGLRTTAGSAFLAEHLPSEDSTAVARLHAAGSVTLGKLNLHEWAMSISTDNPFYGRCRNPWALERIPGGSSGGSGAALAARLCMGSLGSDTGGSIRLPAAFCGVVGLKPTFGRVPTRGAWPLSPNMDTAGPMARRVRDVALLLQAVAGYDPLDPCAADVPRDEFARDLDGGVQGWRIGLALDGFFAPHKAADARVLALVEAAARRFERLGATVEAVAVAGAQAAFRAAATIIISDAAHVHHERLASQPERFGDDVLAALRLGEQNRATDYAAARAVQRHWRRDVAQLFERYDLLLTPTCPVLPPPHDEPEEARRARPSLLSYTEPFNLAGVPALSLPGGFVEGLPIGLHLVAPLWGEARLLRAAQSYEAATDWHEMEAPPLPDEKG